MNNMKRIPFEHLHNCRDLGGYVCTGGMIGWHKLYRGEVPSGLTETEWEKMKEMGVRTVIDLRSSMEQRAEAYEVPEGIERICYPLQQYELQVNAEKKLSEEELIQLAKASFGESLSAGYVKMIEDAPERIVCLLRTIADSLPEAYQKRNPLYDKIPEELRSYMATPPETMEGFLAGAVQRNYTGLLMKNGLEADTIEKLKQHLIIPL